MTTLMLLASLLAGPRAGGAVPAPVVWLRPYAVAQDHGPVPAGGQPPVVAFSGEPQRRRYPVGTRGSDVVAMLRAVEQGKRAEIEIPAAFANLYVEVEDRWLAESPDWTGDGRADGTLLRLVRAPDLKEQLTTVAWLVAVPAGPDGAPGPDQLKQGRVLWSGEAPGSEPSFAVVGVVPGPPPALAVVAFEAGPPGARQGRKLSVGLAERPTPLMARQRRAAGLVAGAQRVFDRLVLAPETAYVKAFIRKEFEPEVDAMEPVRGLAMSEILRPLYTELVAAREVLSAAPAPGAKDVAWLPGARDMAALLVRDADAALFLSSAEHRTRVGLLGVAAKAWREMEAGLSWEGKPMRRTDVETQLAETTDPKRRLAMARAYEAAFAPLYAADGPYLPMVAAVNAIARRHGFRNFAALRLQQVFGVSEPELRAWIEEAFAATEEPARAFVADLRARKGGGELGYWEVGSLQRQWQRDQLGVEELPRLSEQQALAILRRHLGDQGFDLSQPPYDRITMDYYLDPLKQAQGGVAATATPTHAYFTSNLKPGEPIPLHEFETLLHETLHTLHYQTSGQASGGSSAFQNLMYSYIAEGVTMSGQALPTATPALMRRYFSGLPGFTETLMQRYPEVQRRAEAWTLRRLLVMALMEMNLYEDRRPDGSERPWAERLRQWPTLLAERLWVVPDGIALGQILCRMHPTADQHQLMYAAYPLGRVLVGGLRDSVVREGTLEELQRYGAVIRRLMARGALASQPTVKELLRETRGE